MEDKTAMSFWPPGSAELPGERRQARFREFDKGVFNILELALHYDMTKDTFDDVERSIRITLPPGAREEMLCYTDKIEIFISGSQRITRSGWLWRKRRVHKHLSAEITFDPYCSRLSVWTDPDDPEKIVRFR